MQLKLKATMGTRHRERVDDLWLKIMSKTSQGERLDHLRLKAT
jgi:hypothetical protein